MKNILKKFNLHRCKKVSKVIIKLFVLIMFVYGLVWIPSQQLSLEINTFNILVNKIKNSCQLISESNTREQVASVQKADSDLKIEEKEVQQLFKSLYQNCLFAEGLLVQNVSDVDAKTDINK